MWHDLLFRLRALFRRSAEEAELNDELRFHFEKQVEKYKLAGMSEQEARRRARLTFGGHEQVKEDCREARGTSFVENARQDLRYAVRQLRSNPTFAVVIILTLALSIGANSAIFSVIEGVLIQSLPYHQPDRLVRIFLSSTDYPKFPLNPFDFRDFRARSKSFDSMAAFTRGDVQLSGSGEPIRLNGFGITSGYFRVLGLHSGTGTRVRCKGGDSRQWTTGDSQRSRVALAFRRGARHPRPQDHVEPAAVHRGRRDAAGHRRIPAISISRWPTARTWMRGGRLPSAAIRIAARLALSRRHRTAESTA